MFVCESMTIVSEEHLLVSLITFCNKHIHC